MVDLSGFLKLERTIEEENFTFYNLKFQVEDNTALHLFALDERALKLILEYYKDNKKEYLWSIIMKNNQDKTPIEITIDYDRPRCTDLMLTYVSYLREGNFSRPIYKIFPHLISIGYKSFHEFLNTCLYQTVQMKMIKYLLLPKNEDVFMSAHPSCLLDRDFFDKYSKHGSEAKKLREREMELAKLQRKHKNSNKNKNKSKIDNNE